MLAIDKLDEIKNLYNTNNNKNMKELLSEYAETNIKKFIAEAWAEYILSINPRELSIKVGDIIDREYRNKFGSIIYRSF